jgi:molybdopterin-biosynthesis enzyme MoeA-like protein
MNSFYGVLPGGADGGQSLTTSAAGGSASSTLGPDSRDVKSWYEAMARAWGETLDQQANVISNLSDSIGQEGGDQPSSIVQLTAESLRMQFLSNNAATANNSVGQALESLGRKQ